MWFVHFRVLGLVGLVRTDCDDPTELHVHSGLEWPDYLGPVSILLLYCIAATDARFWLFIARKQPQVSALNMPCFVHPSHCIMSTSARVIYCRRLLCLLYNPFVIYCILYSVCMCVCVCLSLSVCPSVCFMYVCVCVCLSVCLFVCLWVCLSVHRFSTYALQHTEDLINCWVTIVLTYRVSCQLLIWNKRSKLHVWILKGQQHHW